MVQDIETTIEGNVLTVRIVLDPPRLSHSEKTLVVASTGGFRKTDTLLAGKRISVNLTATIPKG